ncbi:MAG: hypothetical protein IPP48_02875 [Chitinophagaceae bacterium]|nr:hypothetical protein [Chitinophagaceae bacterium]
MKKTIFFFSFFLFVTLSLIAQQNHFIYIQTDNRQPFYIKVDKKLLSSSSTGYIIIPKLQEGNYALSVGFPKNEWPEQLINVEVQKKDLGFLLKNFDEKGWGLVNMQTFEVLNSGLAANIKPAQVVKEIEVKPPTVQNQPKENNETLLVKSKIIKLFSSKSAAGTEAVYIDVNANKTDTIRVFIPADVNPVVSKEQTIPVVAEKQVIEKSVQEAQPPKVEESVVQTISKEEAKPQLNKNNCKAEASNDDFIKLRKKMVLENNDDDMVAQARKIFKAKCFSVEQVKNLGVLFLTDEGKYKLFDAAYQYISNVDSFGTLQAQLTTQYYINRFKAIMQ